MGILLPGAGRENRLRSESGAQCGFGPADVGHGVRRGVEAAVTAVNGEVDAPRGEVFVDAMSEQIANHVFHSKSPLLKPDRGNPVRF